MRKGHVMTAAHREKLRAASRGKRHSAETRAKMRAAHLGRKKTAEHARNISLAKLGWTPSDATREAMRRAKAGVTPWNKGRRGVQAAWNKGQRGVTVPWNKGMKTGRGPWAGKTRGPMPHAWREKIAASNRKPKSPAHAANILGARWHGPRPEYNGIRFRSSYEVRFAARCDRDGVAWQYEPKRFDLGSCSYLPDFYLPLLGMYVELKGYFSAESQGKVARFRQLHPELPLVVVMQSTLERLEGLHGSSALEDQLNGLVAQQCANDNGVNCREP